MKHDLILHHCAKQITRGSLDFALALFNQMDCPLSYHEDGATWAMVAFPNLNFDIQLIERDRKPITLKLKRESHIAFISNNPENEINRLYKWVKKQNKTLIHGKWSDKEHYFDCPEVFVDFVIEIMNISILEKEEKLLGEHVQEKKKIPLLELAEKCRFSGPKNLSKEVDKIVYGI